jgi:hypothetical protein
MTPYGLTTEQRTEPPALDDTRPRLSWKQWIGRDPVAPPMVGPPGRGS